MTNSIYLLSFLLLRFTTKVCFIKTILRCKIIFLIPRYNLVLFVIEEILRCLFSFVTKWHRCLFDCDSTLIRSIC